MNWLDYILIAIFLFSIAQSFRRGFSREVIGLAAMFFAFLMALWFYGLAGSFVSPYVESQRTADMIGFFLVVIGVLLVGSLAGWIVSRILRSVGLSFFDRMLGAVFGFARGVIISMVMLTAWMAFGSHVTAGVASRAVVHSRIAPYVLNASRLFVAVAPMDLKRSFRSYYSQMKIAWDSNEQLRANAH